MNRSPTPGGVFRGYFVGVRCIINNPFAAKWQAVSSCRGRFIAPAYLYSICICNPFETHSRNVRNVFVICVLHIRRVKVWFLRCKSMVFGVQKGGFCIAKVWFLFFECCVVAICLECYHNPFAAKWQSVSNILAIRQQCFGKPFATFWQSVSSRREPIYRARIYEYTHEMGDGNAYSMK